MLARARWLALVAPLLPVGSALAQGTVRVVDDDPGGDFTAIQPAIDASAPGDVIVVRAGTYANFSMAGKGVTVLGDEGALVTVQGVPGANETRVSGVPAGQRALLRNLDFVPPTAIAQSTLRVDACAGVVWIEDVSVAEPPVSLGPTLLDADAVEISNSAQVVLVDATIVGARGVPPGGGLEGGQEGLVVRNSTAHLHRCDVKGGATVVMGSSGRIGTRVDGSFVSLRDSVSRGGQGGSGFIFFGTTPGPGGPGLSLNAGSEVWSNTTQLLGGPGGIDALGGAPGPVGPPFVQTGGTLTQVSAPSVALAATGLVRDDDDALLGITTAPGSPAFLLVSFGTTPTFVAPFADALAVGLAPIIVNVGATSALGKVDLSIGIPPLPPGLATWSVTAQFCVLAGGAIVFSDPSVVTIVDDAY